jgi:hypothetical protein
MVRILYGDRHGRSNGFHLAMEGRLLKMDRFTEESASDLECNFRRSREPEPFYAEALPCEACGRPATKRVWNAEFELWIGLDCQCATAELPIEPRCMVEYRIVLAAEALGELSASVRAHRLTCPVCNGTRKPPMSQTAPVERKVAA